VIRIDRIGARVLAAGTMTVRIERKARRLALVYRVVA